MIVKCAFCEETFADFYLYKLHLKVYHNKKTYHDRLLCGQNSCPRDFTRFQTLQQHIIKVHSAVCDIAVADADRQDCSSGNDPAATEMNDDRLSHSSDEAFEQAQTTVDPCD